MRELQTSRLRRLSRDAEGGMLTTAAMAFPVLFAVFGLASDYAMLHKLRTELQAAADAAALAAAHEIPLAQSNPDQIVNAAKAFAEYQLTGTPAAAASSPPSGEAQAASAEAASDETRIVVDAQLTENKTAVTVNITEHWVPFFAHFLSGRIAPIQVEATARYVGSSNICVLGLDASASAVTLANTAKLQGNNCAVYSNSTSSSGLAVQNDAVLQSRLNCVADGYSIDRAQYVSPTPLTDCPPLADPLAARQPPSYSGCDHTALIIDSIAKELDPGVYCKGLVIRGTATVTLKPGTYVIDGGSLQVQESASLTGEGAGFYLTGKNSTIHFVPPTTVNLSAPTEGPLADLLFFEDRAVSGVRNHRIASNNARKLLGTIYLSKGTLKIDASKPVADQSAYTAVVVKLLLLSSGPTLVLNTGYHLTEVPVPYGIAGTNRIVLSN